MMKRRTFLRLGGASGAALLAGRPALSTADESALLGEIEKQVLWRNRDGGAVTWFHPRGCMIPRTEGKPLALMTLQEIAGSDYFGPVHWTLSDDLGKSWTDPAAIPSLGRRPVEGHEGLEEGACDVVPEYHAATDTVLAMGHNVYYRGAKFSVADQLARYPVYSVRKADGTWTERKVLEWDDPRGAKSYSNGSGQRVTLPDGEVILSLCFHAGEGDRKVVGVRCSFDGSTLAIKETGPALSLPIKRGLLEPSVTRHGERIFLTMRAEDERGYVAVSEDGLHYGEKKAWTWEDGEALALSTTQQHWLTHSDGLYLVYTREDATNSKVIRWRSPLWVARVDTEKLCLIRETERVVLPLVGDGVNEPDEVGLMGNFHVTNATPGESWVTVGEWRPRREATGDTLLARLHWERPNRLVSSD
ncbi:MAG: exo-alpha-sialidase [Verrucomicrobiaceae bacterium]|nr:exo-alpha-sialidase [Verrucomicrobiaceae bacterium]